MVILPICPNIQVSASFTRDVIWAAPLVTDEVVQAQPFGSPTSIFMDLDQAVGVIGLGGDKSGFYVQVR
jgi:hypothetical protein